MTRGRKLMETTYAELGSELERMIVEGYSEKTIFWPNVSPEAALSRAKSCIKYWNFRQLECHRSGNRVYVTNAMAKPWL